MKVLGLGIAAALLLATAPVMAADLIADIPADEVIAVATSWDGVYVGIGGTVFSSTTIAETGVGAEGVIGVNKTLGDNFLLGGEVYGALVRSSLGPPAYFVVGAEGRAGFLASEAVLLYGATGVELTAGGSIYATVGGGVEFAATENLSIDVEYKYFVPVNNAWQGHELGATLNWHF
jgi:outer membrane immunogenic protein